ncbi:MAG: hypothetical protein ABH824_04710 [Nanoarchaeota archaeon]|nr:hypothetical protein [Nanoarchaeota archaeon]MBU1632293.1 hypothetical protein [Nanoarchaeota archaeon]MBU1875768.1 hypothetical protein [Nanoarchaeota archaeon]
MKNKITKQDLENQQRFVAEGLNELEVRVRSDIEVKAQKSTDCLHC